MSAAAVSRRALSAFLLPALCALPPPLAAIADGSEDAIAYFSAGDPRFLQPAFDEIKYLGVRQVEVGSLGGVPSIRVAYNAGRLSYKRLVGQFWQGCDPTAAEKQFGEAVGPPVIWAASDDERGVAEASKQKLNDATRYSSPTFGPMFKGRPVVAEIKPLVASAEWAAAPDADQGWYLKEPAAYEKAAKKSGRTAFFAEAFKPVTVTACQKEKEQGAVCGFVYFPCSEENGCTAVLNGKF